MGEIGAGGGGTGEEIEEEHAVDGEAFLSFAERLLMIVSSIPAVPSLEAFEI